MIVALEFLGGADWFLAVLTVLDVFIGIVTTIVITVATVLSGNAFFGVATFDGVLRAFCFVETFFSFLVNFIGFIQTIILTVALPLFWNASSIFTLELGGVRGTQLLDGLRWVLLTTVVIVLVDFEALTTGAFCFKLVGIRFGGRGETELGALRGAAWVLTGVVGDRLVLVGTGFEGED